MSAVDAELARMLIDMGELELALAWAEGETRALYAAACIVLAHPELAPRTRSTRGPASSVISST